MTMRANELKNKMINNSRKLTKYEEVCDDVGINVSSVSLIRKFVSNM